MLRRRPGTRWKGGNTPHPEARRLGRRVANPSQPRKHNRNMDTNTELEAPEGIPEGLWVSIISYLSDPDWLPPQGSPGLRAMVKVGGGLTEADHEWIGRQMLLQVEAMNVLGRVGDVAPMPTRESISSGDNIAYPDWVGTIWSQTLLHPWSQDMAEAIEEGEAYVGSKQSA